MIIYGLPVLAYLLGSLASAVIVARLMGLPDPRDVGSKNPGATNLLRYGGKKAAACTLVGDLLKGVVAVLLARAFTADSNVLAATGVAVFLGHLYPIFFGFRGGKGVATALGVWLALSLWIGLALAITWVLVAALFRYSSLAALVAAALAPVYVWWLTADTPFLYASVLISAMLFWRHRSNIRNLLARREGRIGEKRTDRSSSTKT
jgi:acyl phosphate:glycerol-3-phosphate acyltransferase